MGLRRRTQNFALPTVPDEDILLVPIILVLASPWPLPRAVVPLGISDQYSMLLQEILHREKELPRKQSE
jgi:hypothetical protein